MVSKIAYIASAKKDLSSFPDEVRDTMAFAIDTAADGGKHPDAKPLQGFGGARVLEVVEAYRGDAYRAVYTVKFTGFVYVLHAFQKKSNQGSKTPKPDMDLIKTRLKSAEKHFKALKGGSK